MLPLTESNLCNYLGPKWQSHSQLVSSMMGYTKYDYARTMNKLVFMH